MVLSDPLHHSTHWHYITSNQIIPKKNPSIVQLCSATTYFSMYTQCMYGLFWKIKKLFLKLIFIKSEYLTHFCFVFQSKYMSLKSSSKSHLFKITSLDASFFWFICWWKCPQGFEKAPYILSGIQEQQLAHSSFKQFPQKSFAYLNLTILPPWFTVSAGKTSFTAI